MLLLLVFFLSAWIGMAVLFLVLVLPPETSTIRESIREPWPSTSTPALTAPGDYTHKGTVSTLPNSDLPVYEVGSGEKAVIVIYDVFGFDGGRTKAICDEIAAAGPYTVILPDFYRGDDCVTADADPFCGNGKFPDWAKQYPYKKRFGPDLKTHVLPYLKSKGVTKMASVGFCKGAYIVFSLSGDPEIGPMAAGVSVHPALQIVGMMEEGTPESLAEAATCPQLLLPAGNDPEFNYPDGSVPQKLKEKGVECESILFKDMQHGWCSRGDLSNEAVKRDVAEAMTAIKAFLAKRL